MGDWFANLMQRGRAHSWPALARAGRPQQGKAARHLDERYDRYGAIVQTIRAREPEDRREREKRLSGYKQALESSPSPGRRPSSAASPIRLYRFPTRVPCRVAPEARALLDHLRKTHPGSTVTFQQVASGQQAVMLTGPGEAEPRLIGWVEHCVQADPRLCNLRHQGLAVETEGGTKLVLRFRYPPTAVRMSSPRGADEPASLDGTDPSGAPGRDSRMLDLRTPGKARVPAHDAGHGLDLDAGEVDDVSWVDFTEIRPALDMRSPNEGLPPRLVMLAHREVEMLAATRSREYEAFYVRFKHEVLGGIWRTLSNILSEAPGFERYRGAYYTLVREPDPTDGRIYQRTIDDSGRVADIGLDRIYDASAATDILVLYLAGDILADIAEIYFAIQSLGSADAHFLKEEFFTLVRGFWSDAQSLTSPYGSEPAAVVRMSLRVVPTPVQANLLKEDWTSLRQILVDRYGEGGQSLGDLLDPNSYRPGSVPVSWPFASFPAGDVNVGLRLVYRQEWRHRGNRRGEVVRIIPPGPNQAERVARTLGPMRKRAPGEKGLRAAELGTWQGDAIRSSNELVDEAIRGIATAMRWPLEVEGSINTGVYGLATRTDLGLESERRDSSQDASTHLTDTVRGMVNRIRSDPTVMVTQEARKALESSSAGEAQVAEDGAPITYVHRRLRSQYEVLTRLAEIQNVVMVSESLPEPAEIDFWWVKQHDWILAKVLLDESFREALDSIGQDPLPPSCGASPPEVYGARDTTTRQLDAFAGTVSVRPDSIDIVGEWKSGYREVVGEWQREERDPEREQAERLARDFDLDAKRDRLYEHVRANILHYQRAIWQQEDPQQRSLRYRKSGRKVPMEWRFELELPGALTIDELGDRLAGTNVDGQFAAYSRGREVDLDQVIDPSGPIGFYGNYAVYHMRPEFASEDLFSMLHFFKSPYLRPDPDTGAPEVADPVLIQISEDADVTMATDEEIERNRDGLFRYVPQLRRRHARGRRKVKDGTEPADGEGLKEQYGAMRRHYAEYLFRRRQSRRIVLDSNTLVIDVMGRDDPSVGGLEQEGQGIESSEPGQEKDRTVAELGPGNAPPDLNEEGEPEIQPAIVLNGAGSLVALRVAGFGVGRMRDPRTEGVIIPRGDGRPVARLLTGAGASPPPDAGSAPGILARGPGEVLLRLSGRAGAAQPSHAETQPVISVGGDGGSQLRLVEQGRTGVGESRNADGESGIALRVDGLLMSSPFAGAGTERRQGAEAGQGIVGPFDGDGRTITSLAAGGGAGEPRGARVEPVVLVPNDGGQAARTVTGGGAVAPPRGAEGERVVAARGDGGAETSLRAGGGTLAPLRGAEVQGAVAGRPDDGRGMTLLGGGGALASPRSPAAQRVLVAPGDGGAEEGLPSGSAAGHRGDFEADEGIVLRSEGGRGLSLVVGQGAGQRHGAEGERVIVMREEEGRMLPTRYFDSPERGKRGHLAGRH